jgi:hypothetical protein
MPRILGMEPRVAALVGGAIALVAFLAWRARKGSAAPQEAPPGLPDALPGAGAAAGAAGQQGQDQYALAMQNLEIASATQEQQFRAGQLKRQEKLEEAQGQTAVQQANLYNELLLWVQGKGPFPKGVQCPKGKVRFDASTGNFYCRTKQHKSVGQFIAGAASGAAHYVEQHPETVAAVASTPSEGRASTQERRPSARSITPAPKRGFGVKKKVTR